MQTDRAEEEHTTCCCCCESAPIKLMCEINKKAFVPGETIWVTGSVDNQSNRSILECTARLMQVCTTHDIKKKKKEEKKKKKKGALGLE